jgi:hypothetical protein
LAYFTGVFLPKFIETNLQAEMASKAARFFVTHFSNFVHSISDILTSGRREPLLRNLNEPG